MTTGRFRCSGCGAKFSTEERANAHINKRHKNGALWIEGDLTIWTESVIGLDADFKYWAICELHGSCVGTQVKSEVLSMSLIDFCEICNGIVEWCRTCGQCVNQFGTCQDNNHDIGPGSLAEFYAKAG
jgi:hypothetical protein